MNRLDGKYQYAIKLVILCVVWYIASSVMGVVGKLVLNEFPYPISLTMVQLISVVLYLIPFMLHLPTRPSFLPTNLDKIFWLQVLLPLSFGKFLSSAFSHLSIWKVPVSYAHTIKATLPLFTVFLSRVVLKETQTYKIYISLLPIILGVAIASVTELSFNLVGLISALLSTVSVALQNIYSKKCLRDHPLHHHTLLFTIASIATVLFIPLWCYSDAVLVLRHFTLMKSTKLPRLLLLLFIDGGCYFSQNVVAFSIIAMVSPLSYAVANCTKRIAIISVSLIILGNSVTSSNVAGMCIAIFGVLCYKKAKYDQQQVDKIILPTYNINNYIQKDILFNHNFSNTTLQHQHQQQHQHHQQQHQHHQQQQQHQQQHQQHQHHQQHQQLSHRGNAVNLLESHKNHVAMRCQSEQTFNKRNLSMKTIFNI